jgi:F-type H+-transporting ATPase subunit b
MGGKRGSRRKASVGSAVVGVILVLLLPFAAWALGGEQHEPAGHEGGGEHAAAGEHSEHGEHALAPINWTDFSNHEQPPLAAYILNLAVLVGIYWYFGKKPVAEALTQRRVSIAKEIEEAQKMRKEAEARAKQYQAKLEKLDEELETTKKALIEAGKGEKERIVREAQEKAERMQRDAQFMLEQELKQMRADLSKETVELAIAAAEELLRKKITPSDHDRLADDYIAELTTRHMRSTSLPPPPGGAT